MKTILVSIFAALLTGCAGLGTYVQQHAVGIALTGTVLGTVAAGESVIINTKTLIDEAVKKD